MQTRWCIILTLATLSFSTEVLAEEASPKNKSVLTLESATQLALEQNPELKSLQKDADAVRTKTSKARYWDDPMVGVRFYQVPFSGGFDEIEDIDYIVRQKFPIGGKDKAQAQMAYHNYQHHLHLLDGKGRELVRDLKTTYVQLFSVVRQIGVNRETEGNLRAMVGGAQAKLAAGKGGASEAMLGQTEVARLLAERQILEQQKQELLAKLKVIIAVPQDTNIEIPSKMALPEWDLSEAKLVELSKIHHPTLEGEKHIVEEKEWGLKAAKKEYIPDINFQAEYVQRPGGRVDAFTGEVMLNVPLIIKKKSLGVKQAEAELASAHFMRQSAINQVQGKIRELYARMVSSARILKINRGTVVGQARQAYLASAQAYRAEQGGFSDVLQASRMLLDAQSEYWKGFAEAAASVFALEEAVGATREEVAAFQSPAHSQLPSGKDLKPVSQGAL